MYQLKLLFGQTLQYTHNLIPECVNTTNSLQTCLSYHLRYGVLNLESCIHLHEIKLLLSIHDKLNCA